jgi:subtilisin family serine protease
MKKFWPLVTLILVSTLAYASLKTHRHIIHKKIRVAVVDTGLDLNDPRFKDHLCPTGHKNFVPNETLDDVNSHGTHVAGLIEQFAGNADYCLLIYKYYSEKASGKQNLEREVLALQEAMANDTDIVNFSGGGPEFDEDEYNIIRNHPKVTFVVAAGNEGENLDLPGSRYYPASLWFKNEIVVENLYPTYEKAGTSNYSKRIIAKEIGVGVGSYLPNGGYGYMSGTSQATAIHTGKLVDKMSRDVQ